MESAIKAKASPPRQFTVENSQKAIAALGAAIGGALILAGVDASRTIEIIGGALMALTPVAVYFATNPLQVDLPYARKGLTAVAAAVTGVCLAFNIDVSTQVAQVVGAGNMLLPVIIGLVSNE